MVDGVIHQFGLLIWEKTLYCTEFSVVVRIHLDVDSILEEIPFPDH